MLPAWFVVVLMALTVYRLTRFMTRDDFPPIKWFREHMAYDDDTGLPGKRFKWVPHWLAELLSCPWCVSAYLSAAVTAAVWATRGGGLPVPYVVAGACWATAAWPLIWEDSKKK